MPDYTRIARSLDLADPMQGQARTPDVVDAVWWLALPRAQACVELAIKEADYPRVYTAVAGVVDVYLNRLAQGRLDPNEGAPIIKRRRTKRTTDLFRGGHVRRIGSPHR